MNGPVFPPRLERVIAEAEPLAARFGAGGHRLYLVGGVVRDNLLDRPGVEQDLDATTDARPERIRALIADIAEAVWTQGERFGTIGCTIDGQTWEITTHRAEAYDDHSRKPAVTFGDRIEQDLARRDFTVNAMAIDLADRSLVDPHGGRRDLATGVLRTPLDPEISFSEDPLRMLRAARFRAGYRFEPVPELTAAIIAMADRIEIVSAERIRDELEKLILLDDPTPGLDLLAETELLGRVLPRFSGRGTRDVDRLGRRLAAVPADAGMRWAVLLFDPAAAVPEFRALKFSNQLVAEVTRLMSYLHLVEGRVAVSEASARNEARRAHGTGRAVEDYLAFVRVLRELDGDPVDDLDALTAQLGGLREREPDLDDPIPILTGGEVCAVLGIEPGPVVGEALGLLSDRRMAEGPLEKEAAIEYLRTWWAARDQG